MFLLCLLFAHRRRLSFFLIGFFAKLSFYQIGHRKLRAFVTHGGLLSMYEAVYHGVPLVTMPVFCDHDVNAAKAVADGYALRLDLETLTSDKLSESFALGFSNQFNPFIYPSITGFWFPPPTISSAIILLPFLLHHLFAVKFAFKRIYF